MALDAGEIERKEMKARWLQRWGVAQRHEDMEDGLELVDARGEDDKTMCGKQENVALTVRGRGCLRELTRPPYDRETAARHEPCLRAMRGMLLFDRKSGERHLRGSLG